MDDSGNGLIWTQNKSKALVDRTKNQVNFKDIKLRSPSDKKINWYLFGITDSEENMWTSSSKRAE